MLNMLKIRLQRIGRKNDPSFRVVLTDSKNSTKSGRFKEILGSYNVKTGLVSFKNERVSYWLANGAQASDTVHNYLVSHKVIEGKKKNVLSKKSPTKARKELKK
jgi:small subunit ribosomal protein S16